MGESSSYSEDSLLSYVCGYVHIRTYVRVCQCVCGGESVFLCVVASCARLILSFSLYIYMFEMMLTCKIYKRVCISVNHIFSYVYLRQCTRVSISNKFTTETAIRAELYSEEETMWS